MATEKDELKYLFGVGDLHGRYDLYKKVVTEIYRVAANKGLAKDSYNIVFLGDYLDRGEQSKEIIEDLIKSNYICLKGNHEQMMLDLYNKKTGFPRNDDGSFWPDAHYWLRNGGMETLKSYGVDIEKPELDFYAIPPEHIKWLFSLPVKYETEKYAFVHAGIMPGISLAKQDPYNLMWIRNKFLNNKDIHEKYIVHGHTPSQYDEVYDNRTNLDGGGVWTDVQLFALFDLAKGGKPVYRGKVSNHPEVLKNKAWASW